MASRSGAGQLNSVWSRDHEMFERRGFRCLSRAEVETNGAALHEDDRVVAIFANGVAVKPTNIPGLRLFQHLLERERGKVVALVNNDMAVFGDKVPDLSFALKALDNRNVDLPVCTVLPPPICPMESTGRSRNVARRSAPLVQELLPVHHNQCVDFPMGDQPCADGCLAECGRRTDDAMS